MTPRRRLAEALLRIYPDAWRREYGDELFDMLISRPLTSRVAADVLVAGLRQRIRAPEPATVLGVATVVVILSQLVLTAAGYHTPATAMLRATDMTFPTVAASFMVSPLYPWLLIAGGWWTARRHPAYSAKRCGVATMRMSLIGGIPLLLAGVLLAADVITAAQIGLGEFPRLPLAIIVAPLARLPEAWLYGMMGHWIWCAHARWHTPA
jgi:hypothetical protein